MESGDRNKATILIFDLQLRNFLIIPIQVVGSRDRLYNNGPGSNPKKYSRMLMSYGAKVDGYAPFEHSKELYSVLQLATLRVWGTDTGLVDVFLENGTSSYGSLVTLIENLSG